LLLEHLRADGAAMSSPISLLARPDVAQVHRLPSLPVPSGSVVRSMSIVPASA
jgi:hypothetical protein